MFLIKMNLFVFMSGGGCGVFGSFEIYAIAYF
jgi:hypothetical protein